MEQKPNRADIEDANLALSQTEAKKCDDKSPEEIAKVLEISLDIYTRLSIRYSLQELFHFKLNKANLINMQYVADFSHHSPPAYRPSISEDW